MTLKAGQALGSKDLSKLLIKTKFHSPDPMTSFERFSSTANTCVPPGMLISTRTSLFITMSYMQKVAFMIFIFLNAHNDDLGQISYPYELVSCNCIMDLIYAAMEALDELSTP
jgi:hypothetical protein